MSQNSKAKRDIKKKASARKKVGKVQFYVAVDPDTGQVLSFETEDHVTSTYAAVGPPEVVSKLKTAVKQGQGKVCKTVIVSRTKIYEGALIRLPALGIDLMGLVGPVGLEIIPLSMRGIEWLRRNNFAAPPFEDPMEIMVYTAGRMATLEFNRPFVDLADVSSAIPEGVIESMAKVVEEVESMRAEEVPPEVSAILE